MLDPYRVSFRGNRYDPRVSHGGGRSYDRDHPLPKNNGWVEERNPSIRGESDGEVCSRYNWRCDAYCEMTNHYHIVVETPEANLSEAIRLLLPDAEEKDLDTLEACLYLGLCLRFQGLDVKHIVGLVKEPALCSIGRRYR
jgi:hypothetical protein